MLPSHVLQDVFFRELELLIAQLTGDLHSSSTQHNGWRCLTAVNESWLVSCSDNDYLQKTLPLCGEMGFCMQILSSMATGTSVLPQIR